MIIVIRRVFCGALSLLPSGLSVLRPNLVVLQTPFIGRLLSTLFFSLHDPFFLSTPSPFLINVSYRRSPRRGCWSSPASSH